MVYVLPGYLDPFVGDADAAQVTDAHRFRAQIGKIGLTPRQNPASDDGFLALLR